MTADQGQLSADDLARHPEVIVVRTYDDLKQQVHSKIAIWIDKGAIRLVNDDWLVQDQRRYYPFVVVGYGDALYAFRQLGVSQAVGPVIDYSKQTIPAGFSVTMILKEGQEQRGYVTESFHKGFPGTPTVQAILDQTDPLLARSLAKDTR